jgi:hypothetical protein
MCDSSSTRRKADSRGPRRRPRSTRAGPHDALSPNVSASARRTTAILPSAREDGQSPAERPRGAGRRCRSMVVRPSSVPLHAPPAPPLWYQVPSVDPRRRLFGVPQGINTASVKLEIARAVSGAAVDSRTAEVMRSIANALAEVVLSGVSFPAVPSASAELDALIEALNKSQSDVSGRIGRADLDGLRDALARSAWSDPNVWSGEVPVSPLHDVPCGWGAGGAGRSFRTIELAIDALDLCSALLGPDDQVHWQLGGASA